MSQKWVRWTGQAMLFPCFEAWISDARIAIVDSRPPKCEPNLRFNCFPCNIYHLPLPSRETWLENASQKWVRCSGQAMLFPCRSSLDARPRCVFIVVLNATFWHRGWKKCVSKMGLLNRPGHAVSLFWGLVFGRRDWYCRQRTTEMWAKPSF